MADKRTRSDSSAAAVQAMKNAAVDTIDPPSHAGLEKKAEPFWHDNIRSKALDSWTPADLLAAVELHNQLYITVLRKDYAKSVYAGRPRRRPFKDLRSKLLSQRTIPLSRDLQIHSHATNGESRDQKKRNQNDRDARNTKTASGPGRQPDRLSQHG
ncbi:MAG: terminase [Enterobacter hormaechei]